jgi:hypothetical protein
MSYAPSRNPGDRDLAIVMGLVLLVLIVGIGIFATLSGAKVRVEVTQFGQRVERQLVPRAPTPTSPRRLGQPEEAPPRPASPAG